MPTGAILLVFCTVLWMDIAHADETPPGCPAGDCGLSESGARPFDAIVLGAPKKVLTLDEMRALYRWAKPRVWRDFPDDEADYLDRNRVVLLPTGAPGKDVLVHMARSDYFPEAYRPGALVRYTPRAMPDTYTPDGRPAHSALAGCVALVCGAGDAACLAEYPTGMFRFNDGIELDPRTKTPLPNGRRIDPVSLRERGRALRGQHARD
jgi:hypothetical protein